jgi:hypothetical protein
MCALQLSTNCVPVLKAGEMESPPLEDLRRLFTAASNLIQPE